MNYKEKAKELVEKFKPFANSICPIHDTDKQPEELELQDYEDFIAKNATECALIAVDEILKILDDVSIAESGTTKIDYGQSDWQQVRQEIELMKE